MLPSVLFPRKVGAMSQQEPPQPPSDSVPGPAAPRGPGFAGPPEPANPGSPVPPGPGFAAPPDPANHGSPVPPGPGQPPAANPPVGPHDPTRTAGPGTFAPPADPRGPGGPGNPGGRPGAGPRRSAIGLVGGDDPLLPHLVWEGVLLILAAISVIVTIVLAPSGPVLEQLLGGTASVGLVASAVAVSLRTGTPNLAAGAMTTIAGLLTIYLVADQQWRQLTAAVAVVVVFAVIGLVLGGITGLLSMPGWAVTLGGMVLMVGISFFAADGRTVSFDGRAEPPSGIAWFALFAVVSLCGAGLWLVPPVRRVLGAVRRTGDPSGWHGRGAFGALAGMTLSGLLCGLAGAFHAYQYQAIAPSDGMTMLVAGFAAALLGGASVFGRRAGLTGTLFASLILGSVVTALALEGVSEPGGQLIAAGIAIIVGLAANRGMELLSTLLSRRAAARHPNLPPPPGAPSGPPGAPPASATPGAVNAR